MVADASCNGTTYGVAPEGKFMTGQLSGESSPWDAVQYAIDEGAHTQTSSHSYKIYFSTPPNYKMHRDVGNKSLLAGLIRTNSTSNEGCGATSRGNTPPFSISAPGNLPPPYLDPNQKLVGRRSGVIGVAAWFASSDSLASYSPCGPFAWNLAELNARHLSYRNRGWPHPWSSLYNDYPSSGRQMGLLKPDVASPTGTLTSTLSGCSVRTFSGTSNATPNAMGCIMLWKGANRSLKPEDVAMIVHQTSRDRGSVPGKENRWGAGVIDAFAGTLRALCVHRVNGDPARNADHKAGTKVTFELDGSTNAFGAILLGGSRQKLDLGFVELGLGPPLVLLAAGSTGASGEAVQTSFTVPTGAAGIPVHAQAFIDDSAGPSQRWLSSNVIGTAIVP